MTTTRRDFVLAAGGLGAALAAGQEAAAAPSSRRRPRPPAPAEEEPWFRISLAQWSLHREIRSGRLDNLDFAKRAKFQHRIDAVEYVNQFFADRATDFAYLGEMKQRATNLKVESLLIMVDGEGPLAASDESERLRAVEKHVKWLAAARYLGCHSIRVNAQGDGPAEERAKLAADSLNRLARLAEDFDLNVLVENHGGLSSNGAWLAGVMRLADHPRVGTLPDFGNFRIDEGEEYDRYEGVRELMPFAKAVSAKSHAFDEQGNETGTDYARMLGIVRDAGYRGWVGIEYEGEDLPEDEGIKRTRELLERVRAELDPALSAGSVPEEG